MPVHSQDQPFTVTVLATSGHLPLGTKVARDWYILNTAKTVVGTLQKWPTKAGGRSPKGPALAGTTVGLSPKKITKPKMHQHREQTNPWLKNTGPRPEYYRA